MALSGSFTGTTSNEHVQPKITWSATQSVSGNYSNVTAIFTYSRTNAGYTTHGTWRGGITINGTRTAGTSKYIQITQNSNTEVVRATTRVNHNANGSKSITISADGSIPGTSLTSTSCSKTITLDTIPRQATITSAPNFTDDDNPTVKFSNPAGTAVTSLAICISMDGGKTATVPYKTISDKTSTSYTFSLSDTERDALRNSSKTSKTKSAMFMLRTVISGETYYSKVTKTLTIANATPTLSPTVTSTNETSNTLTGSPSTIIKGYNTLSYAFNATALKGATISKYSLTCGSASATASSGTLSNVSSGTFTFTVTDSRGYTKTSTLTRTMVNYSKPTANLNVSIGLDGVDSTSCTISIAASGGCYKGSFGASDNTVSVYYRLKTGSGSYGDWTSITPVTLGTNSYSCTANVTGLDSKSNYTIQTRVVDAINDINSSAKTITLKPVFDWGPDDFNVNVPLNISGGTIQFTANDGCIYGLGTDGKVIEALCPQNVNNNTVLGHDNYANKRGNTNIYGHDVNIGVSNIATPGVYRPYFRAGDSIDIYIKTAGYLTDSNTDVSFYIPLAKPVIGSPTVTVVSRDGLKLRQEGYTHGSSAGTFVKPASYRAGLYANSGISVTADFTTTTSSLNNQPIGVEFHGTITFT